MTRGASDDACPADDPLERLDRIADDALELHALVAALPTPERDALHVPMSIVLAEIGRCIAQRLGTDGAPGSDEAPPQVRRMSA